MSMSWLSSVGFTSGRCSRPLVPLRPSDVLTVPLVDEDNTLVSPSLAIFSWSKIIYLLTNTCDVQPSAESYSKENLTCRLWAGAMLHQIEWTTVKK